MDWLFIALTLGCVGFLVKIILDYLREVPQWSGKVRQAESERDQYESQVQGLVQAKEGAAAEAKTIGEEIKVLEKMRDGFRAEIEKTKKEMARKGRIIMNRQNPDS